MLEWTRISFKSAESNFLKRCILRVLNSAIRFGARKMRRLNQALILYDSFQILKKKNQGNRPIAIVRHCLVFSRNNY